MKFITVPAVLAMLVSQVAAHSWLECVDTKVENKAWAEAHPSETMYVALAPPVPRSPR